MAYVGFFYLFPSINLNWFWFWCITSFWVLQIWVSLFVVGLQILNFDSVSHSLTSSLYAFLWLCHHFIVNFKQRLAYPHQNSSILRFNPLLLFVVFLFSFFWFGVSVSSFLVNDIKYRTKPSLRYFRGNSGYDFDPKCQPTTAVHHHLRRRNPRFRTIQSRKPQSPNWQRSDPLSRTSPIQRFDFEVQLNVEAALLYSLPQR